MANTVFEVLKEKLEEDIRSREIALGEGRAKDFAEYAGLSGLINGLKMAVGHVNKLERAAMEEEDD